MSVSPRGLVIGYWIAYSTGKHTLIRGGVPVFYFLGVYSSASAGVSFLTFKCQSMNEPLIRKR